MLSYTAKRLGQTIFVLLGISLITFVLLQIVPGDPVALMLHISTTLPLFASSSVIPQRKSTNEMVAPRLAAFTCKPLRSLTNAERSISMSLNAVSYTHLDVYKRQG